MLRSVFIGVSALSIVLGSAAAGFGQEREVVNIGVLIDGDSERSLDFREMLRQEIEAVTGDEYDVRTPDEAFIVADWTRAGVEIGFARLLSDRSEVDVVLVVGAIAAHVASRRSVFPKPVIAPLAIDAEVQGFPFDPATRGSGVHNFTYANILTPTDRDIRTFLEIHPFEKLAVIIQPALAEAMPELPESILERLEGLQVEVVRVPARATAEETVAAIPDDVEAVYVLPLLRFGEADIDTLARGLRRRGLPSFSMFGRSEVELGLLAALRTDEFWRRLARRVALNLQRVLLGEDPAGIPVLFPESPRLVVNMRTARAIGVYPPWEVVADAELLHEQEVEGLPTIGLTEAVKLAVKSNLDLAAFDRQVAAGAEVVNEARGLLRPLVTASTLGSWIDDDRATASLGSVSEKTLSASLSLDQVIYSEPAFANLAIQRRLQESLEVQRETVRFDIIQEAATAYLRVLRAIGFFEVQLENVRVTRSNLELAQIRQRIGAAGASEVYRWETAIAGAEQQLVAARELIRVEKVNLNRVLNRDQASKFVAEDVDLSSPVFMTSDERFFSYVYSERPYEVFIDFMVDVGLSASTELGALDAAIAAAERAQKAAKRQLYLPEFVIRAEVDQRLAESGAGSDPINLPIPVALPQADDTDWSIGLFGALPLYTGGSNTAAARRAREELYQLRIERGAVSNRIEQRIRTALHFVAASYVTIELSERAAAAALKSLDLVIDAYAQGSVSITELLDAQNAARGASEAASNAVYDFLIDLMEVERSISMFDFFQTAEERNALFAGLAARMAAEGVVPRTIPPPNR